MTTKPRFVSGLRYSPITRVPLEDTQGVAHVPSVEEADQTIVLREIAFVHALLLYTKSSSQPSTINETAAVNRAVVVRAHLQGEEFAALRGGRFLFDGRNVPTENMRPDVHQDRTCKLLVYIRDNVKFDPEECLAVYVGWNDRLEPDKLPRPAYQMGSLSVAPVWYQVVRHPQKGDRLLRRDNQYYRLGISPLATARLIDDIPAIRARVERDLRLKLSSGALAASSR